MENNPFKPKARFIFHAFTSEAEWLMAFTLARRRNPKSADHSCMPRQDGVRRNFQKYYSTTLIERKCQKKQAVL